jgi:hypothetical protein
VDEICSVCVLASCWSRSLQKDDCFCFGWYCRLSTNIVLDIPWLSDMDINVFAGNGHRRVCGVWNHATDMAQLLHVWRIVRHLTYKCCVQASNITVPNVRPLCEARSARRLAITNAFRAIAPEPVRNPLEIARVPQEIVDYAREELPEESDCEEDDSEEFYLEMHVAAETTEKERNLSAKGLHSNHI